MTAFSVRDTEETASIRQFRQENGYASAPRYISIDRRVLPPDLHVSRIERRRDQPESRVRRLFTLREEAILRLEDRGGMS